MLTSVPCAIAALVGVGAAFAQVPERVESLRGTVEATPLDWRWEQLADIRAHAERFGGFDPERIVVFGIGDDAFPAALLAFDVGQPDGTADVSPICAAIFINGMNFDASSPDTLIAKRKFAEDPAASQLSPIRYAANAPPTLLMTEALNSAAARRSDALAAAIRASGGIAVRATYPRFEESDPTTYLGYSENPSTDAIALFLQTYCPAKKRP